MFVYCSTSCVDRACEFLFPVQHDDFPRPSKWTVRVKSIASPPSVISLIRSHFFHSRTAIMNAADTFSDVFADVSMKLTTWNSWHQASTSSGVISRSFAGTSFCFGEKEIEALAICTKKDSFSFLLMKLGHSHQINRK